MVGEVSRVHLLVGMSAFLHNVEVFGAAGAMVRADKVDDLFRKPRFLRHLDAVEHVGDDDLGTLDVGDIVMRVIATMLVLSKIHRILHLADVMVQSPGASQQRVASNLIQHLVAEVGHLHTMLESAGRIRRQLPQQRRVGVVQLHQSEGGGQAKHLLEEEHQRKGQHREQCVQSQQPHHRPVDGSVGKHHKADINHNIGHKQQQGSDEIMPS